ncbi:aspartate/glutamate racemase family protein [Halobacillus sp. HZG1]|uniref:aspartate/glutamate racemase family protein n=1 Tax=Halobacillus sp. HZG1 TaxID=3111769 RepID=UPI002DBC4C7A|nr:aspartate/glutamate racemase family protein [Halobacillus sp. HZG1]MEC3884883.1 aspartate/glutamate racemase family protein [Halobacillus sp. HZG1]
MSKRVKIIIPVPVDLDGVENRRSQLPEAWIRPGYEVEFVSVKNGASLGDSYYDTLLMDMFVFEAGLKAEEEGYQAVCIDTVSDSGLYALRSRLEIPVFGPGQTAFYTASMLGHKFSVITMWDEWFHLYRKTLNDYGLKDKLASLRSINTRPDLSELLSGKEEIIFEKLERESWKAIEEDGADVIVLGSTTMHQSYQYLKERLPVPVVNPGLVMYKYCEVFLELGLTHSKKAFPSPEINKDEVVFNSLMHQN